MRRIAVHNGHDWLGLKLMRRMMHVLLLPIGVATTLGCHGRSEPAPMTSRTDSLPAPAVSPPSSATNSEEERQPPGRKITADGRAMGTHISFAAFTSKGVDEAAIRHAFDAALTEFRRIEDLMTTWKADSEVSRINQGAFKGPVGVGQETFDVIQESLRMSELSGGTFDITFEALHGLWKFDEDLDPNPPSAAAVKARLPLVNYRRVHLNEANRTVSFEREGMKIGLGGIAKGYAVDRASKVLEDAKLESFYVQAGGDLYTRGHKPDGSQWISGVRDPRGRDGDYFVMLPVSDHAFSTAGDYERSYIAGGKRYHHIIDPRTGFPATLCRSVTIWAKTALLADGIDDAVFILGPEKGLKLVESLDDVGAVIVDKDNNLWVSERLKGKLALVHAPKDGI